MLEESTWYVTLVYKIAAETEEDAIAAARAGNGRLIEAEAVES